MANAGAWVLPQLARFPAKWNHFAGKESRQINILEQILIAKVFNFCGICSKDPGPWEGEPRNMWKPTQQEALWFHGGNLHQSRHYSQFLSLQINARKEGIATPVYGKAAVYHKA